MTPLPRLMLAPNGARRSKADHPALPITIAETVAATQAAAAAGADGLHAHVRDGAGAHTLDAGLYRELLAELATVLPGLFVQITSEAAGRYDAPAQQALVRTLSPASVSVAVREMVPTADALPAARAFYAWAAEAGVAIQHILYDGADTDLYRRLLAHGDIPGGPQQVILVLGDYAGGPSDPDSLPDRIAPLQALDQPVDWMVCAFGPAETPCLVRALALGGKARVGFENSLWNADGSRARDNTERVAEVVRAAGL